MSLPAAVRSRAILTRSFAEREVKSLYKRTVLGWLWSLLKPLTTVAVYSLVFGVIYRAVPPPTASGAAEHFALYVFSGLVVWNVFTGTITGSMRWMHEVSELRKKIYFPTETALLGGAVATLMQSALEAAILLLLMGVLGNVSLTWLFIAPAMLLTAVLGIGIGFVAAILNVRYRDISHLAGITLNVAFFTVPIVYTPDLVPDRAYGLPLRQIIEANPLNSLVSMGRDAVYFLRVPALSDTATATAWACAAFVAGWFYFRSRSMRISEEP